MLEQVIKALKTYDYIGITGKAGTGKSTLIREILKYLISIGEKPFDICITAMTHNAVNNSVFKGLNISYITIASLLGRSYFDSHKTVYRKGNYIIVDECSMLSEEDFKDLIKTCYRSKVIFVGDIGQVGPLGKRFDIFSNVPYLITLYENHRFGFSPLSKLANMVYLKNNIPKEVFTLKDYINDDNVGYKFITAVQARDLLVNTDIVSVCYTNEFRRKVNSAIKKLKYPNKKHFFKGQDLVSYSNSTQENIFNSQIFKVTHVGPIMAISFDLWKAFPNSDLKKYKRNYCYIIQILNINIQAARTDCGEFIELFEVIKKIKKEINKKDWEIYKTCFMNFTRILLVDDVHCLTIHKAQGMTYDNTIVWLHDIVKCIDPKTANSLFYTAITRSKNITYIVK